MKVSLHTILLILVQYIVLKQVSHSASDYTYRRVKQVSTLLGIATPLGCKSKIGKKTFWLTWGRNLGLIGQIAVLERETLTEFMPIIVPSRSNEASASSETFWSLEQSAPVVPARQSRTLDHPRIAHRLYSIITTTYKHPEAIMHSKQRL